jgi:hypothetical protein
MTLSEPPDEAEDETKPEGEEASEPSPAVDVSGTADGSEATPSRRWRPRRPSLTQAAAFVAVVAGITGLVFKFAPGCEPQPPSSTAKATTSDVRLIRPVSFRRFLQRQQIPIQPGMGDAFLARRGVMVEFHYEIIGLSGKHLQLSWELSDSATNELVAAAQGIYELVPSKEDDSGAWAIWIPAPKPGRTYYATVTIYKPQGPPYELTHFLTPEFRGFPATSH